MTDWRRFPWANIWLIAVAVAGFKLVGIPVEYVGSHDWPRYVSSWIALATLLLVGLTRFPVWLFYEPSKPGTMNLNEMAVFLFNAWRMLWKRKWVFWIFGGVAVIRLLGGVIEVALFRSVLHRTLSYAYTSEPGFAAWLLANLNALLLGSRLALSDAARLIPDIGHDHFYNPPTSILFSLVLAAGFVIISSRLKLMTRDAGIGPRARFAWALLVPAVVGYIIISACSGWQMVQFYTAMRSELLDYPAPLLATPLLSGLFVVPITAFLIAGLAGAFRRITEDKAITINAFLRDAVRYLQPVMLPYLLLWALQAALWISLIAPAMRAQSGVAQESMFTLLVLGHLWQIFVPFLILTPYAAVIHKIGAIGGLKRGIQDWFANAKDTISFIALGVTFIGFPLLVRDLLANYIRMRDWPYIAYMPVSLAVDAVAAAYVAVAVWEFYRWIVSVER